MRLTTSSTTMSISAYAFGSATLDNLHATYEALSSRARQPFNLADSYDAVAFESKWRSVFVSGDRTFTRV